MSHHVQEIKERLRELIAKALNRSIDPGDIHDKDLVANLGIDSIVSLEILISVEDEFEIRIDDEDLDADLVDSLDHLANYVVRRQGA